MLQLHTHITVYYATVILSTVFHLHKILFFKLMLLSTACCLALQRTIICAHIKYLYCYCCCGYIAAGTSLLQQTEIGEKGVTLSGGQQQRVALARALYSDADVYLLDDVLSAVDAHVGEHLFKHCIHDLLVKRGKTVVLVSHQIPLTARYADKVVLIARNGTIAESGNPQALMTDTRSKLYALIHKVGGSGELSRDRALSSSANDSGNSNNSTGHAALVAATIDGTGGTNDKSANSKDTTAAAAAAAAAQQAVTVLIKEEERAKGAPPFTIYIKYCIACGGVLAFLGPYIALHLSYNGLQVSANIFAVYVLSS
jgi:ABC-type glutathione transport system ATPase component